MEEDGVSSHRQDKRAKARDKEGRVYSAKHVRLAESRRATAADKKDAAPPEKKPGA